jgi:RNA-directed DNA polymerase
MELKDAYDLTTLAAVLNCTAKQLGYYLYKIPLSIQYKRFSIPKRRGGTRIISAPFTNLKIIQRNLASELSKIRSFKPCVKGFVEGRNIKQNAIPHVSRNHVLNIDLQDFFGSINFARVYGLLLKPPYAFKKKVAAAIAKACTLDDALPQGAPTSPIISNLICAKMDAELARLAARRGCTYTRYADDLTFSTSRRTMSLATNYEDESGATVCDINSTLRGIIESNGFRVNEGKVRLRYFTTRQEVTGLIVNQRVNVKRRLVRQVRAMLHAWRKYGLPKAQEEFRKEYGGRSDFRAAVRGKIEFIGQIRERPDAVFRKLANQFNDLSDDEKIRTALTPEEIAKQATWVIEYAEGENIFQGTAFFTEKYGLVTCAHCLGPNLAIYHPAFPTKRFSVEVQTSDDHRDLAIINIPGDLTTIVPIPLYGGKAPADGSEVILLGYPNHGVARPIRIEGGKLIRTFPQSAVSYFEITPKIIEGNSGGPLLNRDLTVIGIAVRGLNKKTDLKHAEFIAVNAAELKSWLG